MRIVPALVLSSALACGGTGHYVPASWEGVRPEPLPADARSKAQQECLLRAETRAYVEGVQKRMHETWTPPDGTIETINLRFQLEPGGDLVWSAVLGEDTPAARSALEALRRASPFGQMPTAAACLAGVNLVATFYAAPARQEP